MNREAYDRECKDAWDSAWDLIEAAKTAAWRQYSKQVQDAARTHLDEPEYTSPATPTQFPKPPPPLNKHPTS